MKKAKYKNYSKKSRRRKETGKVYLGVEKRFVGLVKEEIIFLARLNCRAAKRFTEFKWRQNKQKKYLREKSVEDSENAHAIYGSKLVHQTLRTNCVSTECRCDKSSLSLRSVYAVLCGIRLWTISATPEQGNGETAVQLHCPHWWVLVNFECSKFYKTLRKMTKSVNLNWNFSSKLKKKSKNR